MVHRIGKKIPAVENAAFIAWNAEVAGDAHLGKDVNVWFGAVIRADIQPIRIGRGTSVQDNATVHVDYDSPCVIGEEVTIGHNAVIHACTVGDRCLIGMGAVILSRAEIGDESIVGAGALVTEGKTFPPRSLIVGSPARAVRTLREEEVEMIRANAASYIGLAKEAARDYREINVPGSDSE